MKLTEELPRTITVGGKEIPICWDFKASLKFAELLDTPDMDPDELSVQTLEIYFENAEDITDYQDAFSGVQWFFSGGEPQCAAERKPSKGAKFSYTHDAPHIYAAFMQTYGIDLMRTGKMHWWVFRALLEALPEDTHFCAILGYRSADISRLPAEQKAHYREMKKLYALPDNISGEEQQRMDRISEILAAGGSVQDLLGGVSSEEKSRMDEISSILAAGGSVQGILQKGK